MKKIFMTVLAAAVAVGCSQKVMEVENPSYDIKISSGIEASATSKAIADPTKDISAIQFLRKDGVAAQTNFTGVTPITGTRIGATGAITFSPTQQYALNNDKAYFVAYWPAGTLTANTNVKWTIDGKTDILLTKTVYDAGSYGASLTGAGGDAGVPMTFQHVLSQLEVICKADNTNSTSEAAVRDVWGKVTKIELLATPGDISCAYADRALTPGATAVKTLLKSDYTAAFAAVDLSHNAANVVTAAGMYAPTTAAFKLKVYTEKVTAGQEVTVTITDVAGNGLQAGKNHKVTLTFKASGKNIVVLATTIDAWTDGAGASQDMTK